MLDMILILNLLRLLCPNIWSTLENVPCALEKNVYSATFGWNVLYNSFKSTWSNISIKAAVSLLTFFLDYLFTDLSGMLKFPTLIFLIWSSLFRSANSFIYSGAPMLSSVQSLSRVRLCHRMKGSTPGLPVHHQLPQFTQTHVHLVDDAIQPSHPLSSPSPPALSLSQHQDLFKWVSWSHQMAKVLEFQLQHQSFQWIFRTNSF